MKSEEIWPPDNIMASNGKSKITKKEMAGWIASNYKGYFQKYNLSCEAAIIRMICSALGISHLTEDDILRMFPVHKSNPELGLVIDDIDGDSINPDGTINWANYGAHAEVLLKVLSQILTTFSLADQYSLEMANLDDNKLKQLFKEDETCLGVIVWVAAYINGKKPPVNANGQVLGEHVQYVSPLLDSRGRFMIYDVWPWPDQPFRLYSCLNRELFNNKVIIIRLKG